VISRLKLIYVDVALRARIYDLDHEANRSPGDCKDFTPPASQRNPATADTHRRKTQLAVHGKSSLIVVSFLQTQLFLLTWQDSRAIPLRAHVVKIRLIRLNITSVHIHMSCTNSPLPGSARYLMRCPDSRATVCSVVLKAGERKCWERS
jgi:hypothetical protein